MKKKSKFIKRLLSAFFAVLCIAVLCVPAFAADDGLIDYGSFEAPDYHTVWIGEIKAQYPFVLVSPNKLYFFKELPVGFFEGFFLHFDNPPTYQFYEYDQEASIWVYEYTQTASEKNFSLAEYLSNFWANYDLYDQNSNLVFETFPVGFDSSLFGEVTTMVDFSVGWVGQFVTFVTSNPLLLCFIIVAFVGLGIGLISRLKR